MPTIRDSITNAMSGATLLGHLVKWETTTMDRAALRTALAPLGVEIGNAWEEGAFRRAMRAVNAVKSTYLARILKDDNSALVYAVADTALQGDAQVGDNAGQVVNRALWRKVEVPGRERFAFEVEDAVAVAISERFTHYITHLTADEVRELVHRRVRSWRGIKVQGSLFFVGANATDDLSAFSAALRPLGTDLLTIPVPALDSSREFLGVSARRELGTTIKNLRDEVGRWMQGARSPRQDTLQTRLESYRELREELSSMTDILALQADDLQDSLAHMEQEVLRLLDPNAAPNLPSSGPQEPAVEPEPEPEQSDATEEPEPAVAPSRPSAPARPSRPGDDLESLTDRQLSRRAKDLGLSVRRLPRTAVIAAIREAGAR